jgi:predicted nucleotidyltransferase
MKSSRKINKQQFVNFLHREFQVHDWDKVHSAYIIGSFVDPTKEFTDDSDIDVMLFWEHVDDYIENQNTYKKGINGTKSVHKWDNPTINTPENGERPVDILEFTKTDQVEIPRHAVQII